MSGPSWTRVAEVFHQALDLPADRRARFLDDAARGDAALRAEVDSLLAAHGRASSFLSGAPEVDADHVHPPDGARAEVLAPGTELGQYRILGLLGEGGMGVVYLAEDTRLGRPVALKAIAPRLSRDAASRARLEREARAAAALTDPGIATVYALETFGEDLFLVSEYVPGETLRSEIARGPLSPAVVRDTTAAIARALAAAHARGIVHRDLKPENVMRQPDGRIRILDFGLAHGRDVSRASDGRVARLTRDGVVLGTPGYMPPEQIRSESLDARADLFSLGVVMYELLAGWNPFTGESAAATLANVLERDPPPLPMRADPSDRALVAHLDAILRACIQKAPSARVPSATALVDMLTSGVVPSPKHDRPAAFWWWQFHQAAASVCYVALLVPLWLVHERRPGLAPLVLFYAGMGAAVAAASLRLHLWFAARAYPEEWARQHRAAAHGLALADLLFAAALLVGAGVLMTADAQSPGQAALTALLTASAVAVVITARVIEPATRRAAGLVD